MTGLFITSIPCREKTLLIRLSTLTPFDEEYGGDMRSQCLISFRSRLHKVVLPDLRGPNMK